MADSHEQVPPGADTYARAGDVDRAVLEKLIEGVEAIRRRQESAAARTWEVLLKATVPIVGAMLTWAVFVDRQVNQNTDNILDLDRHVQGLPPDYLKGDVAELKRQNTEMLQRLARMEAAIEAIKDNPR